MSSLITDAQYLNNIINSRSFYPKNTYTLLTIVYILSFTKILSGTSLTTSKFNYIQGISLASGKMFFVHSDGTYVFDNDFQNPINEKAFSPEDKLYAVDEAKLVSIKQFTKYDYIENKDLNNEFKIILVFIKKKLYLFSPEGEYLTNYTLTDTKFDGKIYDLIPFKVEGKSDGSITQCIYHFVIVFINSENKECVFYYKLQYSNFQFLYVNLGCFSPKNSLNTEFSVFKDAISCQFTYTSKLVFTCLLTLSPDHQIATALHNPENAFLPLDEISRVNQTFNEISTIKSSIGSDKTKILYCFVETSKKGTCLIYDAALNQFANYNNYLEDCKTDYLGLQVFYSTESNNFLIACSEENSANIKFVALNDNFEKVDIKNEKGNIINELNREDCEEIITFSILYQSNDSNFNFLSDNLCGSEHQNRYEPINVESSSSKKKILQIKQLKILQKKQWKFLINMD